MLSSEFIHSPERVEKAIKVAGDAIYALEPLRIHFPERFVERELATIEDIVYVLGFMAIITEDNHYSAPIITAMIRTEPDRIGKVVVDDVAYVELSYNKGSKIAVSTDLVVVDNLIHRIYTEMYGKGRIPWYYMYEDIPDMFVKTGKYNGTRIAFDDSILEYLGACLCRDPDDIKQYFRQRPEASKDASKIKPKYIAIRNVTFGASNAMARLSGSYFDDGMTAELVNPSDRAEPLETALRQ